MVATSSLCVFVVSKENSASEFSWEMRAIFIRVVFDMLAELVSRTVGNEAKLILKWHTSLPFESWAAILEAARDVEHD